MADIAGKKIIIRIAAAGAAVLVFAAVALSFLIDADRFRPQIESRLSAELGRDVRLGKLRLSLFFGRLSVNDISIMDNPEFGESPFVTARSFHLGVKRIPFIFSKKIHITEISLEHPSIFLRRFSEGEWNIFGLGAVAGVGTKISAGKPPQSADIRIERLQIIDGRIEIIPAGKKTATYGKVSLTVDNLSRDTAFPFTLAAAPEGGGTFYLHGIFGPLNHDDTPMKPLEAVFKITGFDPAASGFIPTGAGFSGLLDFSGDINSDGGAILSKGKASVADLRLGNGVTPADKPVLLDYDLRYDLKKKTGTLADATVGFGRAGMRLYGNFDASGDVTNIKMTLKGSDVSVDELQGFLPALGITLPKGAALEGGTLDTEINSEGFLNDLTMDGSVEITGTSLTGFNLGDKIAPVANFAGLKPSVDTQIEKLYVSMRRTVHGVVVDDIHLVVPALGEISGTGTISPRQELDFVMRVSVTHNALAALTKGKALETGFFIRGSAADPEFIPDYKDAARVLIDAVLTGTDAGTSPVNKLMDSLKGLLGR